jgi:hypothetical protein
MIAWLLEIALSLESWRADHAARPGRLALVVLAPGRP